MNFLRGETVSVRWIVVAASLALCAGCASPGGAEGAVFDKIVVQDVPLLEDGPGQLDPPSRRLSSGARVRVLSAAGAHAFVETVDGAKGFVPVSAIGAQGSL